MAHILVVDDDELLCEAIGERLRADEHMVSTVHDGDHAVQAIRNAEPDLVILDHNLPGITGMGVLRAIREDAALEGVPIMMLTAQRGDLLLARAHEGGADDYVRKPVDLDELAHRAESLIKGGWIARQVKGVA
jgi:DNA-binding response OmpR family regulator